MQSHPFFYLSIEKKENELKQSVKFIQNVTSFFFLFFYAFVDVGILCLSNVTYLKWVWRWRECLANKKKQQLKEKELTTYLFSSCDQPLIISHKVWYKWDELVDPWQVRLIEQCTKWKKKKDDMKKWKKNKRK